MEKSFRLWLTLGNQQICLDLHNPIRSCIIATGYPHIGSFGQSGEPVSDSKSSEQVAPGVEHPIHNVLKYKQIPLVRKQLPGVFPCNSSSGCTQGCRRSHFQNCCSRQPSRPYPCVLCFWWTPATAGAVQDCGCRRRETWLHAGANMSTDRGINAARLSIRIGLTGCCCSEKLGRVYAAKAVDMREGGVI